MVATPSTDAHRPARLVRVNGQRLLRVTRLPLSYWSAATVTTFSRDPYEFATQPHMHSFGRSDRNLRPRPSRPDGNAGALPRAVQPAAMIPRWGSPAVRRPCLAEAIATWKVAIFDTPALHH